MPAATPLLPARTCRLPFAPLPQYAPPFPRACYRLPLLYTTPAPAILTPHLPPLLSLPTCFLPLPASPHHLPLSSHRFHYAPACRTLHRGVLGLLITFSHYNLSFTPLLPTYITFLPFQHTHLPLACLLFFHAYTHTLPFHLLHTFYNCTCLLCTTHSAPNTPAHTCHIYIPDIFGLHFALQLL